MTTALSYLLDYWDWWTELDQVAAGGAVGPLARRQRFARLVAPGAGAVRVCASIGDEVADAVDLPRHAQSILELGSAQAGTQAVCASAIRCCARL